jgi:hypothetical protein
LNATIRSLDQEFNPLDAQRDAAEASSFKGGTGHVKTNETANDFHVTDTFSKLHPNAVRLCLQAWSYQFRRMLIVSFSLWAASGVCIQSASVTGAALKHNSLSFPSGFMISVKSYGAVGDGLTDDTSAIQRALADGRSNASLDYYGRPKALYFPPGTYLVHDTLRWVGCCVTLQGSGPYASVIRLVPAAHGFADAATPKPLILNPGGNTSYHQNLWDIGFAIGSGNPGATAINYVSNNVGSIRDVLVSSEDGRGHAGIDLTRSWAGPMLVSNVEVKGFDLGITCSNAEYSIVFQGITLVGQNSAGIQNVNQAISIQGLLSTNEVPVLTNKNGFVVLLDGSFAGGSPQAFAIQTNATAYLRGLSVSGYAGTVLDTSKSTSSVTKGDIEEALIGSPVSHPDSTRKTGSLNLPIENTPSYASTALSNWTAFNPRWYGDTAGLQAVLNSGKSTIYFPFNGYFSYNEVTVTVPDSVRRIVGFSSVINGSTTGTHGGGIRFVVNSNSTSPLIIEQFGYGMKINHSGSRPLAIKDVTVSDYQSAPGTGSLYLEDVNMQRLHVQSDQHVWARQLNIETNHTKITNDGGVLWILGLKTEHDGTVIDSEKGAMTELLGALLYPCVPVPAAQPALRSVDSDVSYMYKESVYCAGCGYTDQVLDTHSGQSHEITSSPTAFRMPLFIDVQ